MSNPKIVSALIDVPSPIYGQATMLEYTRLILCVKEGINVGEFKSKIKNTTSFSGIVQEYEKAQEQTLSNNLRNFEILEINGEELDDNLILTEDILQGVFKVIPKRSYTKSAYKK